MTLTEIDGLFDVAINAGASFVAGADWHVVAAAPGLVIRDNGGLNYRGLDVWITGDTRVADRNEAARLPGAERKKAPHSRSSAGHTIISA